MANSSVGTSEQDVNLVLNSLGTSVARKVTLGIPSRNNSEALKLCLASVLTASVLPSAIIVRLEGDLPDFDSFYFEQLIELARINQVSFTVVRDSSRGVGYACDFLVSECQTPYLWILGDDVLADYECLRSLLNGYYLGTADGSLAVVAGCKLDVNDRRGYVDYSTELRDRNLLKEGMVSQNHFYTLLPNRYPSFVPLRLIDSGNALFRVELLRKKQLLFGRIAETAKAGGEDTLFSTELGLKGLAAILALDARAFHLEKQQLRFSQPSARAAFVAVAQKLLKQQVTENNSHDNGNNS